MINFFTEAWHGATRDKISFLCSVLQLNWIWQAHLIYEKHGDILWAGMMLFPLLYWMMYLGMIYLADGRHKAMVTVVDSQVDAMVKQQELVVYLAENPISDDVREQIKNLGSLKQGEIRKLFEEYKKLDEEPNAS